MVDPLTIVLSDLAVRAATYRGAGTMTAYRVEHHPGLVLHVGKPKRDNQSTRTFYFVASRVIDGKQQKLRKPLGTYPGKSLAEVAREASTLALEMKSGRDLFGEIAEARRKIETGASKTATISGLADVYLERYVRRTLKAASETERLLYRYILPTLGNIETAKLTRRDVAELLERVVTVGAGQKPAKPGAKISAKRRASARAIANAKPGRAKGAGAPKLRQRQSDYVLASLRAMIRWGISEGLAENDPTIGIRKRYKSGGRERALDDKELAALWHALPSLYPDARADVVRLLILTGCRKSEVLEAERAELRTDAKDPVWTIPAARTKNNREHSVPLSPTAQRLFRSAMATAAKIDAARVKSGGSPPGTYVFVSPVTGTPYNGTAINEPINIAIRTGSLPVARFVVHDLRRSVATGMARIGIDRLVISKCLNHATADRESITGLVYDRHDYAKEKREAFQLWAAHLERIAYPPPAPPNERVKAPLGKIRIVTSPHKS